MVSVTYKPIRLIVIILNVVMLSVLAPTDGLDKLEGLSLVGLSSLVKCL